MAAAIRLSQSRCVRYHSRYRFLLPFPVAGLIQPIASTSSQAGTECRELGASPYVTRLQVLADLRYVAELHFPELGKTLEEDFALFVCYLLHV